MPVLKPNFVLTLSEIFSNLVAGWIGAVVIFPSVWLSLDAVSVISFLFWNLSFGVTCIWVSFRLKEINNAN